MFYFVLALADPPAGASSGAVGVGDAPRRSRAAMNERTNSSFSILLTVAATVAFAAPPKRLYPLSLGSSERPVHLEKSSHALW